MNSEWPPWRFRLCSEQKKNSAWSSRMDAKAMTLHALISNCPSSRPNRLSHNYPRLVHQLCGKCNISNNNLRLLNGIIGPEEARPPNPDWEVRRFFIHLECHPLLKTYMRGQFTGKCEKNKLLLYINNVSRIFHNFCFLFFLSFDNNYLRDHFSKLFFSAPIYLSLLISIFLIHWHTHNLYLSFKHFIIFVGKT